MHHRQAQNLKKGNMYIKLKYSYKRNSLKSILKSFKCFSFKLEVKLGQADFLEPLSP